MLCGCVIIPVPSDTQALPDITPFLPSEIRNSDAEVMVFVRGHGYGWRDKSESPTVSKPFFVKANALDSVVRQFDKVRTKKFFWLWGGTGDMGVARWVAWTTDTLCVVTVDGLQIKFVPGVDQWMPPSQVPLHANRRDALVSALRASSSDPFEKVDGPCGVSGKVDWPADLRLRAVDYLAHMPRIEPSEGNARLGQFLRRARANEQTPDRVRAILFARADWLGRDQEVASAPVFLSASALEEFKNLSAQLKDDDNISFFSSLLLPGTYALENLEVFTVCAIDDRGGILYWSTAYRISIDGRRSLEPGSLHHDHVPPNEDWKADALKTLEGNTVRYGFRYGSDKDCLPVKPNWSDAELQRVKAFVNAIPTK